MSEKNLKDLEKRAKAEMDKVKLLAFLGDKYAQAILPINYLFDKQHILLDYLCEKKVDKKTAERIGAFCNEIAKLFDEFMKQEGLDETIKRIIK